MKKLLSIVAIAIGVAVFPSQGAQITQVPNAIINPGSSYSGAFDLTTQGFNPSLHEVTSANAFFVLSDVSGFPGGPENVTISLDGNFFASAVNFIGTVVAGGSILNLSLLNDGSVGYQVVAASGPGHVLTVLSLAQINFEFGAKTTQPVPDGGSMMALLGLSVLGLGWASRRVRA